MGDTLGEIEFFVNLLGPLFLQAIQALQGKLGVSKPQAMQLLADHIDPTKPTDPKVVEALSSTPLAAA
ncbi:MAG: hypothetical protein C5B50_00900 [Verrucomicrobia bacterium]|nr:MAG: hypothetical protein C5B50_00900 [Verrucomicrobiota bacterium]